MATRKSIRWSEVEVAIFLKLVADERIQQALLSPRPGKAYRELSQQMATRGYDRSSQNCREKLKKMKSDYKAIKEDRHGSLYRKDWKWFGQMDAIYSRRRLFEAGSRIEVKPKQEWTVAETGCLIAIWSSPESRKTFAAGSAKHMIDFIRMEMASAGFYRTVEQINNKLKKLKMEYRDKKKRLKRSDLAQMPFFEMMESVLGNTQSHSLIETEDVSPATALLESVIHPSASIGVSPDDDVIVAGADIPPPSPLRCSTEMNATDNAERGLPAEFMLVDSSDNLPAPAAPLAPSEPPNSSSPSCSSNETRTTTKKAKKKQPNDGLLEYLERSDERFFQFSRELMHRMEEDTKSLLGLLGRMVTVMEASNKNNHEHHPSTN